MTLKYEQLRTVCSCPFMWFHRFLLQSKHKKIGHKYLVTYPMVFYFQNIFWNINFSLNLGDDYNSSDIFLINMNTLRISKTINSDQIKHQFKTKLLTGSICIRFQDLSLCFKRVFLTGNDSNLQLQYFKAIEVTLPSTYTKSISYMYSFIKIYFTQ